MGREWTGPLEKLDEYRYRIPQSYKDEMRAPGVIYADAKLIQNVVKDFAPEQVANVATMPGIQKASMAMPDIHWGYGFPIGGVAAFDAEDGVLSPGGVGYDVNCLASDSHVITSHGYRLPISEFEDRWTHERLLCVNPGHKTTSTDVAAFMRFKASTAYRVRTQTGVEITATAEHPFLTPAGMKPLKEVGDLPIAVYPFRGVDYEEPPKTDLVTEETLRRLLSPPRQAQIIPRLKERGLLPLSARNPEFPYLLKLLGFILGDGSAGWGGGGSQIWCYGSAEDLEDIRQDVKRVGFTPSKVYRRERHFSLEVKGRTNTFTNIEESFKIRSSSLLSLLQALGLPTGNKAEQDFELPEWLFELPLWQKRLFLASLFGAEMSAPSTPKIRPYSFFCPAISLAKRKGFRHTGRRVAEQIASLIQDFRVEVSPISEIVDPVPNSPDKSYRFRILVRSNSANLIRFFSTVSFEYNHRKRFLANAAAYYLTFKEMVLRWKIEAARTARRLRKGGTSTEAILQELAGRYTSRAFLRRRIHRREGKPRAWPPFPTFDEFLRWLRKSAGT
ncbi:MAG: RtcB family protein, partial [Thermoplasmata archaeon]